MTDNIINLFDQTETQEIEVAFGLDPDSGNLVALIEGEAFDAEGLLEQEGDQILSLGFSNLLQMELAAGESGEMSHQIFTAVRALIQEGTSSIKAQVLGKEAANDLDEPRH